MPSPRHSGVTGCVLWCACAWGKACSMACVHVGRSRLEGPGCVTCLRGREPTAPREGEGACAPGEGMAHKAGGPQPSTISPGGLPEPQAPAPWASLAARPSAGVGVRLQQRTWPYEFSFGHAPLQT